MMRAKNDRQRLHNGRLRKHPRWLVGEPGHPHVKFVKRDTASGAWIGKERAG